MKVNVPGQGWFLGALTLIFITLKLLSVIAWSWWWVLAPLWAPLALVVVIVTVMVLVLVVMHIAKAVVR